MAIKTAPIILKSLSMQEVYRSVDKVATTNTTVLISGETGVGKEIIAHRIHNLSPRKKRPFNVVNCGALSENGLLMSELFGHEKGAFTDATSQRTGLFENTNSGTLFLDEVGEMPAEVQVKLLRVLESQEFTRLGGNKKIDVDVRVIAATNKCLKTAIIDNEFRQDLYYRINRYPINIPPLREH
ncbi:sigma-54 factor interaction domain-containing protein [Candidatus Poribacteria bacterium]|nr:sigma-54 factor interaction domain-containing protein [Candidatus Poribacteria bacterium]